MVYDVLHKHISLLAWDDAEAALATENGPPMAKEPYKNDLPLHMAIDRHAPEYLILSILKANKDAANVPSKNGALPLHYAAEQNLSASIIVELIRAYPEALDAQDSNKNTPRDYPQRNDLAREALMRPTACWIEDTEKEEYLKRVTERRSDLRRKMTRLKDAIKSSNERVQAASEFMSKLEPRINNVDSMINKDEEYRSQLAHMKSIMCSHLKKIKDRMHEIEKCASENNQMEVSMMNSMLKREYVQSVKLSYDKVIKSHQQIKIQLNKMKGIREASQSPLKESLSYLPSVQPQK